MTDINITSSVNYSELLFFFPLKIFQRKISSTLTSQIWNFLLWNDDFTYYFKSCLLKIDNTGQNLKSVDVKIAVSLDRDKIDEITLCFNTYKNRKQTYTYIHPIPFIGIYPIPFNRPFNRTYMIKEGKSIKELLDKELVNWMNLVPFILLFLGMFPVYKYSETFLDACINLIFLTFMYILLVILRDYIRNKKCGVLHSKIELRETSVIGKEQEKTNLAN